MIVIHPFFGLYNFKSNNWKQNVSHSSKKRLDFNHNAK